MSIYILLEYSDNYSMTSGSLKNYYRDKINVSNMRNDNKTTSKCFEYKTKFIGSTPDDNNTLDTEVFVPLKYLSNFWRSLDLPLIICEIKLDLLL